MAEPSVQNLQPPLLAYPHPAPATRSGPHALPPLEGPKDGKFIGMTDQIAGRQTCIELFATGDSRSARMNAWKKCEEDGINMTTLGRAAKALEENGVNWREARTTGEIIQVAKALRQRSLAN